MDEDFKRVQCVIDHYHLIPERSISSGRDRLTDYGVDADYGSGKVRFFTDGSSIVLLVDILFHEDVPAPEIVKDLIYISYYDTANVYLNADYLDFGQKIPLKKNTIYTNLALGTGWKSVYKGGKPSKGIIFVHPRSSNVSLQSEGHTKILAFEDLRKMVRSLNKHNNQTELSLIYHQLLYFKDFDFTALLYYKAKMNEILAILLMQVKGNHLAGRKAQKTADTEETGVTRTDSRRSITRAFSNGTGVGAGSGANPDAGSRSGSGANSDAGSRAGSGANANADARAGSNTNEDAGSRSGSGANPDAGSRSGPGTNADAGSRAGSGANPDADARAGSNTNEDAGSRSGSGANSDAGSRSGSVTDEGAGTGTAPSVSRGTSHKNGIPATSPVIQEEISEILKYLREHPDDRLGVDSLAQMFHMSPSKLKYIFKTATGQTIGEYRRQLRVSRIEHLLVSTDWEISVIASETGFHSASQFAAFFKRESGLTPREYRRLSLPKSSGSDPDAS